MSPAFALYATLVVGVMFQEEAAPIAGALAAHHAHLDPVWVAVSCALGTWVGDLILYGAGRTGGRFLRRPGLARALDLVQRHPRIAPLVVRFAYGLRFTLPLACGAAHLPAASFALWAGVSAVVWAGVFTTVGWTTGALALGIFHDVEHYELPLIALTLAAWITIFAWRRLHRRTLDPRDAHAADAAARA